jgi:hypothetical protein
MPTFRSRYNAGLDIKNHCFKEKKTRFYEVRVTKKFLRSVTEKLKGCSLQCVKGKGIMPFLGFCRSSNATDAGILRKMSL